jgi:CDP-diacylglycerol--glycerol-3-phosphate 3-phosphatidyltransferase
MVLPNQLTVLRIVLTPLFLILFLADDPFIKQISLCVFIIAALTDWYDGWLARKYNYITNWGKFWDPLADKILTSTAFMAFVLIDIIPLWMVILVIFRDLLITGLRVYAEYKEFTFPTSRYAKWKTFIQMFFLYYLLAVYIASISPQIYNGNESLFIFLLDTTTIYIGMLIVTLITVHSGFLYLFRNRLLLNKLLKNEN